jgi:C-terminal processing protease CtpA/Prc
MGPVVITGEVTYTNPFFTRGVAQPIVILEDQAGFVDRDEDFIFPPASQALAQITSDFYTSPFTYSLSLPIAPQGSLRDVDQDDEQETGVMVFAVAYWNNIWGDPYLERRDLGGGGWSTAYASTRVDDVGDFENEIIGGQLVVYAPDDEQGFPSAFGDDQRLFTEDDPIMPLPAGWSVIDLDTDPFTVVRDASVELDLYEPEGAALVDYSEQGYLEAYDNMLDLFRERYAFTAYKNIDWDALDAEFRPRFEQADSDNDAEAYALALRDFSLQIPDGHVNVGFNDPIIEEFRAQALGGIGLVLVELSDGRIMAEYVLPEFVADQAGIEEGAEILSLQGEDISTYVEDVNSWDAPYSTPHNRRLGQLRYATRFPLGERVSITYQNPGEEETEATLTADFETESLFYEGDVETTGFELPLAYDILPSGYAYVAIYSFFDNDLLTIQLWERLMQELEENEVEGLVIDLRVNGGGRGFLADTMSAYFFDEELALGYTAGYDEQREEFYYDPDEPQTFLLPPENLRYDGDVVIIVGPRCASACEFFAYNMTLNDRAIIVGHYPTAGLGGSVNDFDMPDDIRVRFTVGRALDPDGTIHIEGIGVEPDITLPVTEEAVFGETDVLLEAALDELR